MLYRRVPSFAVDLTGDDQDSFLQGQCTNDIKALGVGCVAPAACLTSKAKVLFLFRVQKRADRLRILLESDRAVALAAHLARFAVFTRVAIEVVVHGTVRFDLYDSEDRINPPEFAETWAPFGEFSATWLVPASKAAEAESLISSHGAAIATGEAERRRIKAGRPAWGVDFDETFLFDELAMPEAVSYSKGCYVGQEIVARVKTYGQVNRRLVKFEFAGGSPEPGSLLVRTEDPGRESGRVTSVCEEIGLGTARREIADGQQATVAGRDGISARILSHSSP